jgi:hypothetical protein
MGYYLTTLIISRLARLPWFASTFSCSDPWKLTHARTVYCMHSACLSLTTSPSSNYTTPTPSLRHRITVRDKVSKQHDDVSQLMQLNSTLLPHKTTNFVTARNGRGLHVGICNVPGNDSISFLRVGLVICLCLGVARIPDYAISGVIPVRSKFVG